MIKKMVAILILGSFAMTSTACIGRMALSARVRKFNLEAVEGMWPHEILFLVLYIIPVYPIAGAIDLIIINSIEFWSGTNPLDGEPRIAKVGDSHFEIAADGSQAISTLREDGSIDFEIRTADGSPHFLNVIRADGGVVARDAEGREIAMVDSQTGELRPLDRPGSP